MSKKTIKLTVEPREITGRKVKNLRKQNIVPANIFGKKIKSENIQVSEQELISTYKEAGETSVIELTIKGTKDSRPVLVSNLQTHPVSGDVLHVDFHQIDLKEKVTATVPVELVGESPAVKEKGGVLFSTITELEVDALPTDIPNQIEFDVASLEEIGDTLTLKDAKTDISKLEFEIDLTEPVVMIQEQKEEEEPEPEETEEAEVAEGEELSEDQPESEDAKKEPKEDKKPEESEEKKEAK